VGVNKPLKEPDKSTDELKKEVEALKGENAKEYSHIPDINFNGHHNIETNPLFQKEIIGNENSAVSGLIKKFNNSDWVKSGLEFLKGENDNNGKLCPFCQQTIGEGIVNNIKDYFDKSYEKDFNELKQMLTDYKNLITSLPQKDDYNACYFIKENPTDFDNKYDAVIKILKDNKQKIQNKQATPSQNVTLVNSAETIKNFNLYIKGINNKIEEHNKKIQNKNEALDQIKMTFWDIMRWKYDQTLSIYIQKKKDTEKNKAEINKKIEAIAQSIEMQNEIIKKQQENTVNIEKAINYINNNLKDFGLDGFSIKKHFNNLYKIVRGDKDSDIFQTLSEGEKMIISFLYFIELCRGKKSADDVGRKKIIVIDDPISSLSHIFIFNIGRLIKTEFLSSDTSYEQIFVLTHSLYFVYELIDRNYKSRKENQKLFRITKTRNGSQILNMKYEEIQNDYHSYWQIVKDDNQSLALIANCMRNIIEYFFNFIEKTNLNNVFQKEELQKDKYQAFYRYINRESHSDGQNIFDIKEFNYDDFKEAFELVFQETGYKEHYDKMIK